MMGPAEAERMVAGVPVVGALEQLPQLLQGERAVDEVFFAVPPDRLDQIADALEACESLGVDAWVLVDVHRPERAHAFVEELFGLPFYGFSPTLTRQGELAAKRLVDVLGASLLLLLSLPVFALIAGLIKAASPGPVLFLQERAGFHGRRLRMYKFRTMVVDAEALREQVAHLNEMDGPVFKAGSARARPARAAFARRCGCGACLSMPPKTKPPTCGGFASRTRRTKAPLFARASVAISSAAATRRDGS